MKATTKSFSGPKDLMERAVNRSVELGYETFSDYLKALIRADLGDQQPQNISVSLDLPRHRQKKRGP